MNDKLSLLGAVFVVQLLIVGVGWIASGPSEASASLFLQYDPAAATRVDISEGDKNLSLTRDGDAWQVAEYPADADKVAKVIEKFADMRAAWPVATTAEGARRFEVSDDNHQRRLRIAKGDDVLADVLLGTSPGYRRVHARAADSDDVYSIDFSNFELPAEVDDWLDRMLLAADGDVSALALADAWQLTKADEGWLVDGAAADQDKAGALAERIKNLAVTGLSTMDTAAAQLQGALTATDGAGDYTLQVYRTEEPDEYAFVSSRREGRFKVANYIAEQIVVAADDLLPETTGEAEADAQEVDLDAAAGGALPPVPAADGN